MAGRGIWRIRNTARDLTASGYNELVHRRRRLGIDRRSGGGLSWLFIATLPNSGSTALSSLLRSGSKVAALSGRAEGQWLLPGMSARGKRWQPDLDLDYSKVRNVWIDAALRHGDDVLIIEKSPTNLVRFRQVLDAFSEDRTHTMRLVRDPYAICASWAKRYPARILARDWDPSLRGKLSDEEAYYRALGDICGRRFEMLRGLEDIADLDMTYEGFTADPEGSLARIRDKVPRLDDIDPGADVRVKKYARQGISDMNATQVSGLTDTQIATLTESLAPYEEAVAAFGYELKR